jgi:hypothetical protein
MQCSGGEQAEAVGIGLGHAQALGRAGHKDQVDVIVHQAPGEAGHVRTPQAIAQPLAIVGAILVREEQRPPAVAARGDVMRHIGENDPSNAGHGRSLHGTISA